MSSDKLQKIITKRLARLAGLLTSQIIIYNLKAVKGRVFFEHCPNPYGRSMFKKSSC